LIWIEEPRFFRGFLPHSAPRRGDAFFPELIDVEDDPYGDQAGEEENVNSEETGKSGRAYIRSAPQDLLNVLANHRDGTCNVGSHYRGPVSLLIPRQKVPGERESEGEKH